MPRLTPSAFNPTRVTVLGKVSLLIYIERTDSSVPAMFLDMVSRETPRIDHLTYHQERR